MKFLLALWNIFRRPKDIPVIIPVKSDTIENKIEIKVPPVTPKPTQPMYLFDTYQNSRHSVRVICNEEDLALKDKEIICACIEQESHFTNYKSDGIPLDQKNLDPKTGKLLSTDWGICQINDTPKWHIGPGLAFPSVEYVMNNPDKVVRFMVHMMRDGKLKLWVSYSSGAYLKYMPQNLL